MSRHPERPSSTRSVTPTQLVGGATAAAAATYAASSSGLAGTVAGAALASVVGTLVAASCTSSLTRSTHALRRVAGREIDVEAAGGRVGPVGLAMAAALVCGVVVMSAGLNGSTLLQRATDLGASMRQHLAATTDVPAGTMPQDATPDQAQPLATGPDAGPTGIATEATGATGDEAAQPEGDTGEDGADSTGDHTGDHIGDPTGDPTSAPTDPGSDPDADPDADPTGGTGTP